MTKADGFSDKARWLREQKQDVGEDFLQFLEVFRMLNSNYFFDSGMSRT